MYQWEDYISLNEKTIKIISEIDEDFLLYIVGEGQEKDRSIDLAKDLKVIKEVFRIC